MGKIKDFIKSNFKVFLGIIIGILVTSGVVYAAVLIDAKDVTYSPEDNKWGVDHVSNALDELYGSLNELEEQANNVNPGTEYLRYDESSKYIQVLTSNSEWKNLYYTETLPLGETYIYKNGTKPYGPLTFVNFNTGDFSRGSTTTESNGLIKSQGATWVGFTMSIQLPFKVSAGSKVHVLVDECKLHPTAAYMRVTNADMVKMPGAGSYDTTVFYNKEYVATINSDIASGSDFSISIAYFYQYGNISKIWIEPAK